ncbi:MAG TPA: hypothetical protein PK295_01525 [Candidatus Magasanikbacteria bacterium]|nr:hypothetical protein [Candidatus Magasanikbacteria bacterium]
MRELKLQLKRMKDLETRINPDREWILRNRTLLMNQIGHTSLQSVDHPAEAANVAHSVSTWTKIFIPEVLVRSFKPVMSVAFALMLTTVGWIASAYAEPGDVLWGAKSAFNSVVENGRLALAPESEQASLKLSYASKQAHILKQVVETTNVDGEEKEKLVEKTADSLQKKLESAQESIKTIALNDSVDLVKKVSLSTQDISQTLKETMVNAAVGGISDTIEKTAVETTKQSLQMVGDAVQKKTDANFEISNEEKELVKDHIDAAVESIIAEVAKAQNKLNEQSTSSTLAVPTSPTGTVISPSSTLLLSTSTSIMDAIATVKTIDEQKKTVNSLKETNLIEALNTTKALAEQVTTVIEKITTQGTTPTVNTPASTSTSPSVPATTNTTTVKSTSST